MSKRSTWNCAVSKILFFHLIEFCWSLNLLCLCVGNNFIHFLLIFLPVWVCLSNSTLLCINNDYWLLTEWDGFFYQVGIHLQISIKALIFNPSENKNTMLCSYFNHHYFFSIFSSRKQHILPSPYSHLVLQFLSRCQLSAMIDIYW